MPPEVAKLDLSISEGSLIRHIILTKRVVLDRGKEKVGFYFSEKSADVTATSKFGLEHEIANVECIISGLHDALTNSKIISTTQFWETIARDKDILSLSSLFDERYLSATKSLNLDYLVVAYNQRINMESHFMEGIVSGGYYVTEREVAAVITVDMKNMREVDATEVNAEYFKAIGHVVAIIPIANFSYPDEDPCLVAGRYAAEAILRSQTKNEMLRVAVVAGDWKSAVQDYKKEPLNRVEKIDGEVRSRDVPSDYASAERIQSLKKQLYEGDDSRELKIELARLGYTEPLEKLAKKGDRQASIDLYLMTGISEPLYKLAERGDVQAAAYLYRLIGDIRPLRKLREQGNPQATAMVAALEAEDARVKHLADATMHKRAEAEDPDAQFQLFYSIKTDERLVWACRAADNGNSFARYRLAMIFEKGLEGFERDNARAQMWYRLAAVSGHVLGNSNADRLAQTGTEAESEEALRLLNNWQPGQCEAEVVERRSESEKAL
jgi:TPR repeat protein